MGFYSVKPATMARLRRQLQERPEEMETLMRRLRRQGEFTLSGETYKKPRAQAPSELLAPWYVLKGFSLSHDEAGSSWRGWQRAMTSCCPTTATSPLSARKGTDGACVSRRNVLSYPRMTRADALSGGPDRR